MPALKQAVNETARESRTGAVGALAGYEEWQEGETDLPVRVAVGVQPLPGVPERGRDDRLRPPHAVDPSTFDSAFDELVPVGPITYRHSEELLFKRVTGVPRPFIAR